VAVNRQFALVVGVLVVAVATGCSALGPTIGPVPTTAVTPLTVGLGYIPSVQFAQFYRADRQGYYRDAGLNVTFQNQIDAQLVPEIGSGQVDIGLSDGTSLVPAVSQGIPVRYAATIYAQFPSVVIARADSGIAKPADLRGKRLGIPGRYGSSWIMLQALLASAGLTPDDLEIKLYPDFGQATALREGQVDAATGFANNEPVQLALAGIETSILRVDETTPLPGQGLTVGTSTLASKRAALESFVAATLRAMEEITANPQLGLDDAIAAVPDLATDRPTQLAILSATVAIWHSQYTDQNGLGAIDKDAWSQSIEFMKTLPDLGVKADLTADQLLTEDLLP
jgi:putative riboflavin transport system substrate-binding protein